MGDTSSISAPLIVLTSPLHPASPHAPAITITRDLALDGENNQFSSYDDLEDDVFLSNDEQFLGPPSPHEDEMFPCSVFRAADSTLVRDRLVVEKFIADRLDAVLGKEEDDEDVLVKCLL